MALKSQKQDAAIRENSGLGKCRGGGKEEGGKQEPQGEGMGKNMKNYTILQKEP